MNILIQFIILFILWHFPYKYFRIKIPDLFFFNCIIFISIMLLTKNITLEDLRIRAFNFRDPVFVLFMVCHSIVNLIFLIKKSSVNQVIYLLCTIWYIESGILVPIFEELYFRSYFIQVFKPYLNNIIIVLVSSLYFAMVHDKRVRLYIFTSSCVESSVFLYFDSVLPCILFHMINNIGCILGEILSCRDLRNQNIVFSTGKTINRLQVKKLTNNTIIFRNGNSIELSDKELREYNELSRKSLSTSPRKKPHSN